MTDINIAELARQYGIPQRTLQYRINVYGMSPERAVNFTLADRRTGKNEYVAGDFEKLPYDEDKRAQLIVETVGRPMQTSEIAYVLGCAVDTVERIYRSAVLKLSMDADARKILIAMRERQAAEGHHLAQAADELADYSE